MTDEVHLQIPSPRLTFSQSQRRDSPWTTFSTPLDKLYGHEKEIERVPWLPDLPPHTETMVSVPDVEK